MATFSGKVKMNELFANIVQGFKTIVGSPWSVYYENASSIVLKSVGTSGSDKLFFRLEVGNTKDSTGNKLVVGIAEDAISSDGSVPVDKVEFKKDFLCHSDLVDTNLLIEYQVSLQANRIIIYLQGDVNSVTGIANLGYFGILNRYATETDSSAMGIGLSYYGDNGIRTLRDKDKLTVNNIYDAYSAMLPVNPGWGSLYHLAPLIMCNGVEGARGEIIDIYAVPSAGVSYGDEIKVAAKTYKVYSLSIGGQSFLTGATVAVLMT
ncbi:hypothetical protein P4V86_03400 [Brevibacillus laterosporus]|uniref:hypothetical protein n=1 Tax=Brevibacillus laterosporus TaxID=1465 RepID=UPI00035CA3C8|nr:hypothetical protein [Brevibacillus laterosporus]ATO48568.1 hypothetical protein BrL25_05230 [Brevibacillus laterosporus DSM 25]MED2002404.1 hypothetical protein [Brevibacillus laterosporus]